MIVCLYSKAKALFFYVALEGQARGILGACFLKGVPLSFRLVFSRLTPKGAHGAYFSNFAYIESSASVQLLNKPNSWQKLSTLYCKVLKFYLSLHPKSNHKQDYEYRERQVTDEKRYAGVLCAAAPEAQAVLRQRHHPTAEECGTARGGGNTLSAADPLEERRSAAIRVAGVDAGTSPQVLCPQQRG